MLLESDLLYVLALQKIPGLGSITIKKLIEIYEDPKAIFEDNRSHQKLIKGINKDVLKALDDSSILKAASSEIEFLKSNQISPLYYKDKNYPFYLKQCIDGPVVLFKTGNFSFKQRNYLSIVGTRKCTEMGKSFCEALAYELKPYNPVIVSGFAYGIDISAHEAALKNNLDTIACFAHGFNEVYPKAHKKYVTKIEAQGAIVSEFWSTSELNRENFLKRNRIIAGLSPATLIVESAEKGGSLVTADIANSYDREVFAVPGNPYQIQSVGCNNLIKSQKAQLVSSPLDIPYLLNWKIEKELQSKPQIELTNEENRIFSNLKGIMDLEELAFKADIPIYKLSSILLSLELKKLVKPIPGRKIRKI